MAATSNPKIHLAYLESQHILGLREIAIDFTGHPVTVLLGKNGEGKTRILCLVEMLLGGKAKKEFIPDEPLAPGDVNGYIKGELTDGTTIELRVERDRQDPSKVLVKEPKIKNALGHPISITTFKDLIQLTSFDPLAFFRLPAPKQLAEVRRHLAGDFDLDQWEVEKQQLYDARTVAGRERDATRTIAEDIETFPDAASEVDTAATFAELQALTRAEAVCKAWATERDRQAEGIAQLQQRIATLQAQLLELDAALATHLASAPTPPDATVIATLQAQLSEASVINAQHEANRKSEAAWAVATAALAAWQDCDTAYKAHLAAGQAALEATTFPLPELSFDEAGLRWQNAPLSQASKAQQIRVSAALGMALNPHLGLMCIRDGSLLDAESEAALYQVAQEYDFQLLIEKVPQAPLTASQVLTIEDRGVVETVAA